MALSTGELIAPVSPLHQYKGKLAKAQRRLAKKKRFSSNWKKQKAKITQIHTKIADTRRDFQHKTSSYLSKNHVMIVIEDLKVKNMSRSAKGDVEKPGKQVKQKAGLNRSILDQGWSEFRGMVVAVSPHYTSQICSSCGYKDKANRQTQAQFVCISCGFFHHADTNAAINIVERGDRLLTCGETKLSASMKQEPLRYRKVSSLQATVAA